VLTRFTGGFASLLAALVALGVTSPRARFTDVAVQGALAPVWA